MKKKLHTYEVARFETWEGRVEVEATSMEEVLEIAKTLENDDFMDNNMRTTHEVVE